ncbi:MAG: hypothetical protein R3F49_13120 [Planctomycetota bacterium]
MNQHRRPDLSSCAALAPLCLSLSLMHAGALAQETTPQPTPQRGGNFADPSPDAFKYGSPPALADGTSQEQMWPAATAEGWQKPVLVKWQRTFDDALAAAKERNAPIMVAVNMDGEIASEHFAGVRYRDAETAALMNRYVCVIASVYRHTPRDYDENGQRVPCPRFGTVTCGEHIEAERELYDKYFDGKRISPRHIMLDLAGAEQYDVYFSWDTATVFTAFRKGVEEWPLPERRTDMQLEELTQSADIDNRERVERMYREGDRETKRRLLESVLREPAVDQVELLRMALFGLDLELARVARQALAQCKTEGAVDLMAEALKVPMEASEREALLAAAARLGEQSHRARTLVTLHTGLDTGSRLIDPGALERARERDSRDAYTAAAKRSRAVAEVETHARAAEARPEDPTALLALAESFLARADASADEPRMAKLLYEDARRTASQAEARGAAGPRLDAVIAVAAAELGDQGTARMRAFSAVEGGLLQAAPPTESADSPAGGADQGAVIPDLSVSLSERARVRLLLSFAEARQAAIRERYRFKAEWPGQWLSDVNSAYASVAGHPLVDAKVLADYHDFLRWIGATPRANGVLDEALAQFPSDPLLHDRLRSRLLWEEGPEGLERAYAERVAREESAVAAAELNGGVAERTQITWFAGYAGLVAAEHYRRRGAFDGALVAYDRALEQFARNIELFPSGRDSADHFVALGLAGIARVRLERGELGLAKAALLASLERRPDSAASLDGLGLTPVATAKMLAARLDDAGEPAAAADVRAALDTLDPRLLEPLPTDLPPARGRDAARGQRQGRGGAGGGS